MSSSLDWKVTRLASGESLRAEGAGSQSVAIFRGMVWITHESDTANREITRLRGPIQQRLLGVAGNAQPPGTVS